jgi:hypothetical protein
MVYVLIFAIVIVLIIQGITLSDIRQKLGEIQRHQAAPKPQKPEQYKGETVPAGTAEPRVSAFVPQDEPSVTPPPEPVKPALSPEPVSVPESDEKPLTDEKTLTNEKTYVMPPAQDNKPKYAPPPGYEPKKRIEKTAAEKTDKNYENFIGGKLFPIIAAILIFIGLIFLAVTAFTRFGAAGKIAIMFGASAVVTAAGIILTLRAKNAFSEAVTGCGLGSFLISLMAAHFYFEYIGVAVLIILLLVWGVAAFALSKKFDSFALSLVSQIGLTVCFIICAFSHIGQDIVYRWGFIAFECAASALIIICGLLSNKKATVSGLCGSSVMLLVTVIALAANTDTSAGYNYSEVFWTPDAITAAARLLIQVVLVLIVGGAGCFLLERKFEDKSHYALMQSVFGVVYAVTFFTSMGVISDLFGVYSGEAGRFTVFSLAVIAAAAVAAAVLLRMRKAEGKYTAAAWFTLSVLSVTLVVHINSYPRFSEFDLSLFLPFAFLLLLLYKFVKFKPLLIFGTVFAGFDWFYMVPGGGLDRLHEAVQIPFLLPLVYLLAYALFGYCFYRTVPATQKGESTLTPARIVTFLAAQITLIEILSSELTHNENLISAIVLCITGTIIWCVYANISSQSKVQTVFLLINEAIILLASLTAAVDAENKGGAILVLIFAAIYAAFRMYLLFKKEMGKETIYSAVKWLFIVHAAAAVFGLSSEYVFSIIIIVYGLLCVVGGFALTNKTLRTAGLVISLFAVVKMTIADVWEADNIVRVAALITGGVICFAVSAIYNKTAKKLSAEKTIENTEVNIETE